MCKSEGPSQDFTCFPSNPELRERWKSLFQIQNSKINNGHRVCYKHFESSAFIVNPKMQGRQRRKPFIEPSLYLPKKCSLSSQELCKVASNMLNVPIPPLVSNKKDSHDNSESEIKSYPNEPIYIEDSRKKSFEADVSVKERKNLLQALETASHMLKVPLHSTVSNTKIVKNSSGSEMKFYQKKQICIKNATEKSFEADATAHERKSLTNFVGEKHLRFLPFKSENLLQEMDQHQLTEIKNKSSKDSVLDLEQSYQIEAKINQDFDNSLTEENFKDPTRKNTFFKKLITLKSSTFDTSFTVICTKMNCLEIKCFFSLVFSKIFTL